MKKILCIAACAAAVCSVFAGCDARDGRVDDGRNHTIFDTNTSSYYNNSYTGSMRMTETETNRGGVIHETTSMVGEVGEDIVDGAKNIGSAIASDVSDMTH